MPLKKIIPSHFCRRPGIQGMSTRCPSTATARLRKARTKEEVSDSEKIFEIRVYKI
jgi:hypothetical protein